MKEKLTFPTDKHSWHPSPLVGQIVLVTTMNQDGTSNVAPKSWISMMAFDPPILAIGCNLQHWTARNVLARKEFVVNVPGAELAETVWKSHTLPHPRPVEAIGLTARPSVTVAPPRIEECKAHLECMLDRYVNYGEEVMLLGRIVATSIDEAVVRAKDPYEYLQMLVYLEGSTYGFIEGAHRLASH